MFDFGGRGAGGVLPDYIKVSLGILIFTREHFYSVLFGVFNIVT